MTLKRKHAAMFFVKTEERKSFCNIQNTCGFAIFRHLSSGAKKFCENSERSLQRAYTHLITAKGISTRKFGKNSLQNKSFEFEYNADGVGRGRLI